MQTEIDHIINHRDGVEAIIYSAAPDDFTVVCRDTDANETFTTIRCASLYVATEKAREFVGLEQ